jgi:hypothetical protein
MVFPQNLIGEIKIENSRKKKKAGVDKSTDMVHISNQRSQKWILH